MQTDIVGITNSGSRVDCISKLLSRFIIKSFAIRVLVAPRETLIFGSHRLLRHLQPQPVAHGNLPSSLNLKLVQCVTLRIPPFPKINSTFFFLSLVPFPLGSRSVSIEHEMSEQVK
jgi:hypothetical protein